MTETPGVQPPGANVPGYLLPLSILATLFCCLPTGIAAIVFSVQARSRSSEGDYVGASQAVRRANISLIITVVLGVLLWVLVFVFGLLGTIIGVSSISTGGQGETPTGSKGGATTGDRGGTAASGGGEEVFLEDLIQERVGDFELQGVEELPEGIQVGAEEALTTTYQGPGGATLTHNLLAMSSAEEADELRRQQVQEQQERLGLRVVYEEPFEDENGRELGTVTVLEGEAEGNTITEVLWSNENLYAEAAAEGDAAPNFFDELDY